MYSTEYLEKKVRMILEENQITGYSKKLDYTYTYTKPAQSRYPFQYFWDTCFHVFILLALGEHEQAKKHLRSLFIVQQDDGLIGNIIYWKHILPARFTDFFQIKLASILKLRAPHTSNLIQPPLVANAAKKIYDKTGDKEFLKEILPYLKKYFNWLSHNRDIHGDGLISIITNFESGMDWKPTYDPVVGFKKQKANFELFLRVVRVDFKNFVRNYNMAKITRDNYFLVKDAGYNSIYARDLYELAKICKICNDPDEKIFKKRAEQVSDSMLDILYDEKDKAFYDVYGHDNKKIRILTPTIFFPIITGDVSDERGQEVMEKHFYHRDEFSSDFPIPSVAKNQDAFNPNESMYIWRGPTWIVFNWLMHKYMVSTQNHEYSEKLINSIFRLIEKSGFREYYNPFTGEGYGAHNFTWSGLVLDMVKDVKDKNKEGDQS